MDSDRRMRCSISVSNPRIDSLASSRVVGYAHAHEQDGVESRDCTAVRRSIGLRADDEAGHAEIRVGGRAIYALGAGCHGGIRDGLV